MVRPSLNNRERAFRHQPRTVPPNPPPGTSRPGRPLPEELPEVLGGERECVPDETTWRSSLDSAGGCARKLGRQENGCCVLQIGRDTELLKMYKHFVDNPHRRIFTNSFSTWIRARDVLGHVSKATISMSNPDFLIVAKLVKRMQSCGTSIDVMVDHTVQGVVMPFKFTKLFLGKTSYIGRVERSDESQSVGRVVMNMSKLYEEIQSSRYSDPPLDGSVLNPVLEVSLINITPIVPLYSNGISYGRRGFFMDSPTQVNNLVTSGNRAISPSRFKFDLGKDFQNYFEYIPDGYESLLPESVEQARALASELNDVEEFSSELIESAGKVGVGYAFRGAGYHYDLKVILWPVVSLETTFAMRHVKRPFRVKSPRV